MGYELSAGQILDSRFKILELIVRGGMANVFKALDIASGETIAIKTPLMQYESNPAFFSRFQREEQIALKLSHPSIVRIIPVDGKSRPYIAMEYLDGETLGVRQRRKDQFEMAEILRLGSRVCEALAYLHGNGVFHRDLKPDNIMLCKDGSIRIMDFGLAMGSTRKITMTGFTSSMGTAEYMAPEQVNGKRGDERTDIYSLGLILYELTTGSPPYTGEDWFYIMNARVLGDPAAPRTLNNKISEQIEEIILHAMARKPADRYQSAAEMKADLDAPEKAVASGRASRLVSATDSQIRWRQTKPYVVAVLVPAILITAAYLWIRIH